MRVQHIPEFIGFRSNLGIYPTINPLHPCSTQIPLPHSQIDKLNVKLTLLRITSRGWLRVIAKMEPKNADINVLFV